MLAGHIPTSVSLAQRVTRIITWGMDPIQRTELLSESDDDWEMMHSDLGSIRVVGRAFRGIPEAMLGRMDDHEATALPAALVIAAIAAVAIYSGIVDNSYPVDVRVFLTVFAIGFGTTGLVFWGSPRRLVLKNLRLPALATAIGLIGMALNMPTESDWPLDAPFVDTPLADVLIMIGFITAGAGFVVIATVTFARSPRALIVIGGLASVAGSICFGTGLIAWGAAAATVDLQLGAFAIAAGLSGYSLAHVLPRVRFLHIE